MTARARRWLRWLPGLAGLLCLGAAALATASPRSLGFQRVDPLGPDGQSIISFLQDKQGFIWIGTIEGGLFRYDGKRAVKYANDPANPRSLPAGRVAALYNDTDGRIWVGTDAGLVRYEAASNDFTHYAPPKASSREAIVRRIESDGAGGMWLATWGGLQHFDPHSGRFELYRASPGLPGALTHNDLNALAVDDRGGVWASTWPDGMDYLPPGATQFQHYRLDSDQQPNSRLNDVRALHMDSGNVLWIGTDAGLLRWKPRTPWSERQMAPLPATRVSDIDEDRAGDVWISTRTAGLWRWDQGDQQFQAFQHRAEDPLSLSSNAIDVTMHDRTGTLWVGSFTDGVSRANLGSHGFARMILRDIAPDVFVSSNFVRSMAGAPDGLLWLGVDDGLVLFDPAARKVARQYQADPKRPGTLSQNTVYSMYQAPGGPLWLGTAKGLNRLDRPDGPFRQIHFPQQSDDFINAIVPARDGGLWLGTGSSLLRYDPAGAATHSYRHDPADPDSRGVNSVTVLLEDRAGRVWTGDAFRGGGLDVRDPASGKFRHLRHEPARADSLSNDYVTSLHEDRDGTIWVGTKRGLNRLEAGADGRLTFHHYSPKEPLGGMLIEAIRSDKAGMVWLTTLAGMSRLDPSSDTITDYAAEDGLTEGYYQNSAAAGSDGRLYFGGTGGFTVLNPAIHSSASRPPQVAIVDLSVFNRSLAAGAAPPGVKLEGSLTEPRALTLPWDAAALSIEFAALHYAEPKRNNYRYKLEGYDRDWILADASRPLATYTNLYPGNYRFHLIASNNKGLDSKDELLLPITVTPPIWSTWWFRGALALLLMLLVLGLYRWRVRRLTAHARQLEALVAERTRELEQSNRKLEALSATDALTGIANRRSFDQALEREWRRAARKGETLALALLDIDHFKLYNDHYGHQQGDACLRQVAQLTADSMHRAGDLVARYGGEEFAFIAPGTSVDDALRLAHAICAALTALELPHAPSPFGRVTASIGVAAAIPLADGDPQALLRAADRALYRAKHDGRNRAVPAQAGDGAAPDGTSGTPALAVSG